VTQQWETDAARWLDAVLELRARVEALEAAQQQPEPIDEEENDRRFHACMDLIRNATPEQIRAAAGLPERKASKVYEINEPLKLTSEQAQQLMDLLTPNSKPAVKGPLLITRVAAAISQDGESINWSGAYAAIREVAAWLDENTGGDAAWMLTREAER
jgi:hypothetical protein